MYRAGFDCKKLKFLESSSDLFKGKSLRRLSRGFSLVTKKSRLESFPSDPFPRPFLPFWRLDSFYVPDLKSLVCLSFYSNDSSSSSFSSSGFYLSFSMRLDRLSRIFSSSYFCCRYCYYFSLRSRSVFY